jgi:diguanylate cyclase (GGDEF)-like protein
MVDGLTGAYLRASGFTELRREMARARRTGRPLSVAFVDVDHLKTVNDSFGHVAGDRLLAEVVTTLRGVLRSYDVISRYGGDEFICAISGLNLVDAADRLFLVHDALRRAPEHGSVTVGLAELRPEESAEELVARADAALYAQREQHRSSSTQEPGSRPTLTLVSSEPLPTSVEAHGWPMQ